MSYQVALPVSVTKKAESRRDDLLSLPVVVGYLPATVAATDDPTGVVWTPTGTPAVVASVEAGFGNAIDFDGSSYLSSPAMSMFDLSNMDFTVECFVTVRAGPSAPHIFQFYVGPLYTNRWNVYILGGVPKLYHGSDAITGPAISYGVRYHLAVVRAGTTITMYWDGVSQGTTTGALPSGPTALHVGAQNHAPTADDYLDGIIEEFRVSPGTARYTTNFTPPAAPLGW